MVQREVQEVSSSELARKAASYIARNSEIERHEIAVTLGSGWGKAAYSIGATVVEIPAAEVPGFNASRIPGHTGTIRSIRYLAR